MSPPFTFQTVMFRIFFPARDHFFFLSFFIIIPLLFSQLSPSLTFQPALFPRLNLNERAERESLLLERGNKCTHLSLSPNLFFKRSSMALQNSPVETLLCKQILFSLFPRYFLIKIFPQEVSTNHFSKMKKMTIVVSYFLSFSLSLYS